MEDELNEAKAALVKSKDDMAKIMIGEGHQPRSTNPEIRYIWTPVIFIPPDPLGNSHIRG